MILRKHVAWVLVVAILCACAAASFVPLQSASARSPRAPTPTRFTSRAGGFRTVIPAGFRNVLDLPKIKKTGDLYFAVGRRVNGFTININVVRARIRRLGKIDKATRTELRGVKRATPSTRFGAVNKATVAGGPARVVDNVSGTKGKMLDERQVYFEHGGWIYVVSYAALPSTFHLGVAGLGQMITAWHWTS